MIKNEKKYTNRANTLKKFNIIFFFSFVIYEIIVFKKIYVNLIDIIIEKK